MNYDGPLPTSVVAHMTGSCIGVAGILGGIWWLNRNPMGLSQDMIIALTIVFVLFLAMFITLHSISHSHMEKNYGIDPLKNIEFH